MENGVIYVRNDLHPQLFPDTTPQNVLKSLSRGIYTTFSVDNGYFVKDWDVHILRLCKSLPAQHAALNAFDSYKSWLRATHTIAFTDAQLTDTKHRKLIENLIIPPIISALDAHQLRWQATVDTSTSQQQQPSLLVCVAITPPHTPIFPPLDIHVLCSLYKSPKKHDIVPKSSFFSNQAVILGGPRKVPTAKDTGWIAERAALEDMKIPGASDILLCDQQGRLLEGLITNVYIVTTKSHQDGGDAACYAIETAATEAVEGGGVAWGTMRYRVQEAAHKLGIQFCEQAPSIYDRGTWREAFLTNSLRGVELLGEIKCDERNVFGHEPFSKKFGSSEVGERIRNAVLDLTQVTDLRELYTQKVDR